MLGRTVAEALDIWGFAEAEFVVTPDGEAYLLEVNPRISGTLRVAAMAASAPIFDHQRFPGGRDWPASGYACEAPYDGAPFVTANVIATSRITCRADDPDHSRAILDRHVVGLRWPAKLQ
ncbi:MAG: hypothetical protein KKA16_01325 [Alphaproteobacteria bacterium]|nr:hypothetical protein [Alphaproteobacteria bacterium]MBU2379520.1 hypothetical protein [Alphaproteobacteria bacterium]